MQMDVHPSKFCTIGLIHPCIFSCSPNMTHRFMICPMLFLSSPILSHIIPKYYPILFPNMESYVFPYVFPMCFWNIFDFPLVSLAPKIVPFCSYQLTVDLCPPVDSRSRQANLVRSEWKSAGISPGKPLVGNVLLMVNIHGYDDG